MHPSDAIWYARAAVWIGIVLLFLMAFLHRQVAVVSVLAVVGIASGVIVLAYSIPFRSSQRSKLRATTAKEQSPNAE